MSGFFICLIIACGFYCGVTWLLPKLLSWVIKKKYRLEAQIGKISVPYFVLHDILIKKNGFSIHIDKILFRSSFLSSEVTKLLCLVICDVRINKDVTSSSCDNLERQVENALNLTDVSFYNQKIPPVIITFAQFLAIHIRSITAMLLRPESPEWLLHASASDVQLDGSLVHSARTLLVNVTITSASAKLLRHAPAGTAPRKLIKSQFATCLAELSFSLSTEVTFLAQGQFSVEKLCIGVENMKAVINEGFYGFVEQRYDHVTGTSAKNISSSQLYDVEKIYKLFYEFAPVIPKVALIKVEKSLLTGMKDNINPEINAMLQRFQIKSCFIPNESFFSEYNEKSVWPYIAVDLMLDWLDIKGSKDNILNLQEFKLDSKIEKRNIFINSSLNTFSLMYNHKEIYLWLMTNFGYLTSSLDTMEYLNVNQTSHTHNYRWLDYFCIEFSIELYSVTILMRLSSDFLLGFNNIKFLLNCDTVCINENEESVSNFKLPLNLRKRGWTCELLMDSLWADLNYDHSFINIPQYKKYHYWGTPFYFGIVLLKIKGGILPKIPRVQIMLDTVRLEWSPPLSNFIHQVHNCFSDYQLNKKQLFKENSFVLDSYKSPILAFNVTSSNVNVFLIADKKVCIMLRSDSIVLGSDSLRLFASFDGVKMTSIIPTKYNFTCTRSDEIKNACLYLKSVQYEWRNQNQKLELSEDIDLCWSTNLHLKLLAVYFDIEKTCNNLLGINNKDKNAEKSTAKLSKPLESNNIKIFAKGKCRLRIKVSLKRQIVFTSEYVKFRKFNDSMQLECPAFKIAADNHNIFTFEGFNISQIFNNEELKAERANIEDFVVPVNTVWKINLLSLKAVFPYEHDFCVTFHNEFLSIVKWLRLIHKKQNTNTVQKLPYDIIFKVKEFLFEMSDDPFEVNLRDNYELLVDEYAESIKREKMLNEKLTKMCKDRLLLPADKVDELHLSLQKINAQIYVQRSKEMRKQTLIRTRLFAWLMSDLQINLMVDPTIIDPNNIVRIMTEIDPDSPWPDDGIKFSTLWCRFVAANCKEWKFQLRDFPQPWLDIGEIHLWGKLIGAEQEATKRAIREVVIDLGEPYGEVTVERSMTSLKFYHDFSCEVKNFSYAFGPCWEPVISQCNLAFNKIVSSSKDPSPPLPFWDKIRFIYHGRLTMCIQQLTFLLHASLDPYNTTEEMEVTWNDVVMDWTNAKFIFKGNLEVYVRTASKYDDCRMLYLPNLKFTMKLTWICLGIPNDHHSVMPYAPDKLPEYSSNQEHDSFRAFRSQNLNLTLALETKPSTYSGRTSDCPVALLYNSTLRWFENLKLILSGVTRPTRRGAIFNNLRPRKQSLSRHYKTINVSLALHRFQVHYWMSFSMQRGLELSGQKFTCSSGYSLNLVTVEDGLRHRPRTMWSIDYMTCELNDAEVWLKSALQTENKKEQTLNLHQPVEKCYFLSVSKVSYGREMTTSNFNNNRQTTKDDTPTHNLVVRELKGAWTPTNRDIIFALYDSFRKTQQLKTNLSTAALKGFRCSDSSSTPIKTRSRSIESQVPPGSPVQPSTTSVVMQETPSPISKLQSGQAASMLQQLIAEAENKALVFSDDLSVQMKEQHLQGLAACQEDDVVYKNWSIALVNSQVLLKGCETKGYVIMSAAKAEILEKIHRPVWKDRTLVSKTSWIGSLECMQYYATVSANDTLDENIMWLSVDNIQEKEVASSDISDLPDPPDLPHLVGSGQSVGGVVSETVGAGNINENTPLQLQRIVSRCKCEFFYAGFGESSLDLNMLEEVPPPPTEETGTPWERHDKAVDSFTLMHHDLDVCTNSLQYAMVLDIVNNLLLYVEPRRKEASERLQRMRFQLQLHSVQDQRKPIQQLQNLVRCLVAKLRRLEKELYLVQRTIIEDNTEDLISELERLELQINECKEQLNNNSEELDMMLSCYKDTQLMANQKLETLRGDKPVTAVRTSEICFKHAQWRLTETDGQLGIADLVLSNFLYTKISKSDDSVEHLLELGYIRMKNLLANELYRKVLFPTEIQSNMPVARKRAVRIFCREKAPVGGISVKEHFEINVVPFTIGLTKKFYDTMMKFCFPERDTYNIDIEGSEESEASGNGNSNYTKKSKFSNSNEKSKKWKEANFYVPSVIKDDVEKMKERAEKNKLFIYIKIPEVPVRVSYKGNKEKNLIDIRDFSLVIPTLEYHNVTWTWLDLFLAMKNDTRRVILSQAIKHKLQIKMRSGSTDEGSSPQEEDKAKLLFGSRIVPVDAKVMKKNSVFKLTK